MKTTSKRFLGLLLSLLLVTGMICVGGYSVIAADPEIESAGATAASGDMVYCQNTAGWSSVYCYVWDTNNGDKSNASWPGEKMTDEGDGVWSYELNGTYNMIIFNSSGSPQTGDMTYPGNSKIYDNKSGNWDDYDTSPLRIKSFKSDVASPQYTECEINFTTEAVSDSGSVIQYQYSVNGTVQQAYSTNKTLKWVPSASGTYTIKVDVKDASGNTNSKEMSFVINDPNQEVKPVFKSASPSSNNEIKLNSSTNLRINAAGGNTGTKLLFYKYEVKDPNGKQINTAYYTLNNTYSFTPTTLGSYTVDVSIQGSDNQTIKKSLVYNCVSQLSTSEPSSSTETPGGLLGDVDDNGVVDVSDATLIQKYKAGFTLNKFFIERADFDKNGIITVSDSTAIQKYRAGIEY